MSIAESILCWLQIALLCPLAIFGLHRGWLILQYLRTRRKPAIEPELGPELPHVTVQLPVFNERYVATRLIDAVIKLDWPHDRLEVQVLDDSTDDTREVIQDHLNTLPADINIRQIHRTDRHGFKAGALDAGVHVAAGEFLAIFDADFIPEPDFLRRTIPHFKDPKVGMVQTRWGHLNADFSLMTDLQAMLLDGHFAIEHVARSRTGCLFNFNGTAGVFRKTCIADAGGWQHDTLTEDLDLSYRAQLAGWRFTYLPDVVSPAELPIDTNAFLIQQHRWAKGSIQCGRKLMKRVWASDLPLHTKLEAVFHLYGNLAFPLLLGLIAVAFPLQVARAFDATYVPFWMAMLEGLPLLGSTICVLCYYGLASKVTGRLTFTRILRLPLVLALGAGMSINNTGAVIGGFGRDPGEFKRTPKLNVTGRNLPAVASTYCSKRGSTPILELFLGSWASATASIAILIGLPWTALFHGLFALGLALVGARSIFPASFPPKVSATPEPAPRTAPAPSDDETTNPPPRPAHSL